MTDREATDEKIIAIPYGDPQWNCYRDIQALPLHIIDELKHFLTVYKQLENKKVKVLNVEGNEVAKKTIRDNIIAFDKAFEEGKI